jgi:hypothetical protein
MSVITLNKAEQELKNLWIAKVGDGEKLPSDYQWGRWLLMYGPHASAAIIRTGRKQHGTFKFHGRVMEPRDLWSYTTGTARRMALEAGYPVPEYDRVRVADYTPRQFTSEALPMGYIPKRTAQVDFQVPQEWLQTDNITRYQPAEWEQS